MGEGRRKRNAKQIIYGENEMASRAKTAIQAKTRELMQIAQALYREEPDWVSFFREMMGVGGVMRTLFPDAESQAAFEQSPAYMKLQQMIRSLRDREKALPPQETTRVITIRIPASLHDSLTAEAYERYTSVNKLCISKLLQIVEDDLVPSKKKREPRAAKPKEKEEVEK